MKTILITGGAGFIGSHFVRHILSNYEDYKVVNLDKLTYAGNLDNLWNIKDDCRYEFVQGDICNEELLNLLMKNVDFVVNFAAESHVDRSILGGEEFMRSNAFGVYTLLEASRRYGIERFLQVSTDEVYGSLGVEEIPWTEKAPINPRNPYSVAKASGDLMSQAFSVTYGLPILITRASNNIGPFQYPEKRLPLFVTRAIDNLTLPVYGKGEAIRDHLYVTDHCEAIDLVLHEGQHGEIYNIGGENEANGLDVVRKILNLLGKSEDLIQYVKDRPGHDMRYSLDSSKIKALGWAPKYDFDQSLDLTVEWYQENKSWWKKIGESSSYQEYYERNYKNR